MNRRSFVKNTGTLGLLTSINPTLAFSRVNIPSEGFLVEIHVEGGWDVTLGPDAWTNPNRPNEKDMFIEYRHDELLNWNGNLFGPTLKPLEVYKNEISVIKGIVLSANDNGHDAAGEYMEKGSSNPSLGSFAAEAENYFAESPLGVLFDQDVELGTREISVTNVNELLGEGSGDSIIDRSKLNPDNRKFGNLLKKVIGNSGIFEQIKKELEEKDDPDRWDAVVTSFKSGGANHAKLSLEDQDLDSHSAHPQNHMRELSAAYSEIAKGLKKFKETPYKDGSLFDHTTFYVFSEFSRTPFLNGANGKDHNPRTNSALVLGKGIIGGKAVGASRLVTTDESAVGVPYHMGMPLDFSTELPTMNRSVAEFIHPEVVIKTLAMAIGMGNGADDLYGRDTRFLKSLLK